MLVDQFCPVRSHGSGNYVIRNMILCKHQLIYLWLRILFQYFLPPQCLRKIPRQVQYIAIPQKLSNFPKSLPSFIPTRNNSLSMNRYRQMDREKKKKKCNFLYALPNPFGYSGLMICRYVNWINELGIKLSQSKNFIIID